MSSWVRRVAQAKRYTCANCDDWIQAEDEYYLTSAGERFCQDCEPEDDPCPL